MFCRIEDSGKAHKLWGSKNSILMMLTIMVQRFSQVFEKILPKRRFPEDCRGSVRNWEIEIPANKFQPPLDGGQVTPQGAIGKLKEAFEPESAKVLLEGIGKPLEPTLKIEIAVSYKEFLARNVPGKKISL
jgi:hypothetical protein